MRAFILICLLATVAVGAASRLERVELEFRQFKLKHGKSYETAREEAERFRIFVENLQEIEQHNALYEQGAVTYTKGINQFTDWTHEEFRAYLRLHSKSHLEVPQVIRYVKTGEPIPDSIDWRTEGQVGPVKSQGVCGSCWAFSVTGSTEAAYYRKSGEMVPFSEQQLLDCTKDVNDGCDGGLLLQTFPYIQEYGIESEESYPYNALDGNCSYNASAVVTKISGYVGIEELDEDALLEAVAIVGPVSVAIDADFIGAYASGVFWDSRCVGQERNHGVLAVGYGTENGTDYWIIKNSWSDQWGDGGYFKLRRGTDECGVAEDASYPFID